MPRTGKRKHKTRGPVVGPPVPPTPPSDSSIHPTLLWVRGLTGPGLFLGGFRMIPSGYWLGISLAYFGLLMCFLEVCFEPWILKHPKWVRGIAMAIVIFVATIFSIKCVFISTPIEIVAIASDGNYKEGTIIDGSRWQAGLSELRVFVANNTDLDYDRVEVVVRPDRLVRGVVPVGQYPGCTIGYPRAPVDASSLTQVTGPGGEPIGHTIPVNISAVSTFTIRCDRLQHHTRVQFLAATSAPDKPLPEGKDTFIYSVPGGSSHGPRKKVEHVFLGATYRANGRSLKLEVQDALRQQVRLKN